MKTLAMIMAAALLILLGMILGFWIEVLTYTPTPGWRDCDCGPEFRELYREDIEKIRGDRVKSI